MDELFKDRRDAGRQLVTRLSGYAHRNDVTVLALPRGGMPVGYEVAEALQAPLDAFIVRKLGMPGHEEYAIGAIASGGVRVLNERAIQLLGLKPAEVESVIRVELGELDRREQRYRAGRGKLEVGGRTAIVVDDGLATGATMRAAVKALGAMAPGDAPTRIVVAVPVGAAETCEALRREVDELVCVLTPLEFSSVGQWYEDFAQTSDAEVNELLEHAAEVHGHEHL